MYENDYYALNKLVFMVFKDSYGIMMTPFVFV